MDLKKIGTNIKKIRLQKGFTQAQLAEMADISTVHMSHIETGSVAISLDSLVNISNSLGTTPDYILLGEYNIPAERTAVLLTEKTKQFTSDENRLLLEFVGLLDEMKINRS